MKSRRVLSATVFLFSTLTFAAAADSASATPEPAAKDPVVMTPFKVSPRGWHVYWSLSFGLFGSVKEVTFDQIAPSSLAGKAGFKDGDSILRINGQVVKGMKQKEMERLLWPATAATLVIEVQSQDATATHTLELRFPEPPKRAVLEKK